MEENSEFIARNLEEVGQARSAANVRTKAQSEAMRKRGGFDENTPDYFFKVGDMVKMKHHERLKLEFRWKGPYHVVDVGHPGTYWIMTPQGLRLPNAVNQNDLAPCSLLSSSGLLVLCYSRLSSAAILGCSSTIPLGVAYYGLELIGGNSTLARRLQAPVNTGIRMILKAPLFTPIAPMLTDCGIISLDAHAILARNHYIHYYTLLTPTISEIRHQRSKYAFERTFQVWGKSKLACSYVQANHASSAKFLRSPALSTGQAIGALSSHARCGGLWDYPRALKADLLHPTATDPDQLGSPNTRFEPPISVAHQEIPRQAQETVEENPTASRTTTTDTPRLLLAHTTPTHISYIGSDDILTVLLGGEPSWHTNTAGNTEACPSQQWLTGTVEEEICLAPINLWLTGCVIFCRSPCALQSYALEAPQEQSIHIPDISSLLPPYRLYLC
ncbi:hypothetical protein BASA83_003729 [Batrachochytrium salamandrivorans]|nr:hypothetical protein BASA83_003729 [Batrachochytrium salamandrivorans]